MDEKTLAERLSLKYRPESKYGRRVFPMEAEAIEYIIELEKQIQQINNDALEIAAMEIDEHVSKLEINIQELKDSGIVNTPILDSIVGTLSLLAETIRCKKT